MGIWEAIKGAFAVGTSTPPDARRLSATNESALSASLKALRDRERGWITLSEVRALFSTMDDQYAFGELNEAERSRPAPFRPGRSPPSTFDVIPDSEWQYFDRCI